MRTDTTLFVSALACTSHSEGRRTMMVETTFTELIVISITGLIVMAIVLGIYRALHGKPPDSKDR